MTTLIEARCLIAGYGAITIVDNLDLHVDAGEVVALLGPNGAGKTTTVMTLAGELPPLGGEVFLNGERTTAPLYRRARSGLGLITEERTVFMSMSVAENLRVNRGDVELALELFPELVPHLKRQVGMLSGGQQQILALARAFSRKSTIILADELSLGLAPIIVNRLLGAIRAIADRGAAVLLVEQQIHKALKYVDRGYVLRQGRIGMEGDVKFLEQHLDEIRRTYLEAEV
jgi:branched-chain amino acid transport system ATP-binding protein